MYDDIPVPPALMYGHPAPPAGHPPPQLQLAVLDPEIAQGEGEYIIFQYNTVQYSTVNYQSLQRVSTMPQSTLDKSSRQHNLFGYHT